MLHFRHIFKPQNVTSNFAKKREKMKIGTWNLERLKHYKKVSEITLLLENQNCDILVLTEYDERIKPRGFEFEIATKKLTELDSVNFRETEKRVKIFSKYEILQEFETYDSFTSCAVELKTEMGSLVVYGTIIGVFGNRNQNFKDDLPKQIEDYRKLSQNHNFCIVGDFNISFCDNYYFTNWGRNELNRSFAETEIINLTQSKTETIDHIAISKKFCKDSKVEVTEWNCGKELSDHKGISVKLH